MPPWITVLSGLLVPAIAVFGTYIAARQASTARKKLRLDLFDRREAVHRTARDAIATVAMLGRLSEAEESAFIAGTRGAKWLFGAEVDVYLNHVWDRLQELRQMNERVRSMTDPLQLLGRYDESREIVKWFKGELLTIDFLFMEYLELQH